MNPFSRRFFLKGLGSTTVALPFLPSLLTPTEAKAATLPKKRFIAIHSGHCQAVEHWLPDPTKFAFTQKGDYAREVALSSIQGNISPVLGAAFDKVRSKLLLLSRLDPTSSQPNHDPAVLLTGGVRSEIKRSLDHVIAQKLYAGPPLNLYIKSVFDSNYSGAHHMSVNNGEYTAGQFNPGAVFTSLFGSSGGGAVDQSRVSRRDLLVVDKVYKEYQALRANKNLSKVDADRLGSHMELIYKVETKLRSTASAPAMTCTTPSGPSNSPVNSRNAPDFGVIIDQMYDVLEVGIKCGNIQVATLMMHVYDYFNGSIGFIPGISGSVLLHEDVGHSGTPEMRAMKLALNRWFGERVARFLNNLNVVEDPTTQTTYLDNSLIMWGNDQGALNNCNAHASVNMPILLAGSAGGYLKTGRYIDYGPAYASNILRPVGGDEGTYKRGRPYNQLLITIAQAMGLAPVDYESAGVEGFGVYGPKLSTHDYLGGNHRREILPLVRG